MRRRGGVFVAVACVLVAAACGSDADPSGGRPSTTTSPTAASPTTPPAGARLALSLRYGSLRERSVDGGSDGRFATAAIDSMNELAVDLYRDVVAREGGNTVLGPYSVTFTLGMIYAGARGATATEMAEVLHVGDLAPDEWHEGINAYDLTLDARTAGSPTEWSAANKVWTLPGMALRPEYLDVLTGAYGSPLAESDFASDPEGARDEVNAWVEERTSDMIPELFPEGSFDASTRMILVNAVAMDAPWEFPFDPAVTTDLPFTRPDGTTVQVPTMRYDEYLPSLVRPDLAAVEVPYGGGALSMVVIVPNDLAAFEADMTADSLAGILDEISDGGIHLSLPKWTARTHVQLNETLVALGMPTAFGGSADFSGMVDGGGLWLGQVEHEAVVEVDEEGTRAAAATGGEMVASHGPTIDVNRPFLYAIVDRGAGTILFMGRVIDPTLTP